MVAISHFLLPIFGSKKMLYKNTIKKRPKHFATKILVAYKSFLLPKIILVAKHIIKFGQGNKTLATKDFY